MPRLAIAMDLGTSGYRAQALDLSTGEVLSTVITPRHPLPGANVMDHLHFALEVGVGPTQALVLEAVNQVLAQLRVPTGDVVRLAVCGNPTQLSLLQGLEIRDLAYAGSRKLKALGVVAPARLAAVRPAAGFPGLALPASCDVIIPPAVRDEIGADALALILQTGLGRRDETSLAIDYGTNAEMALAHGGRIYTGSAAAGPALEGQHITCGTLALPGAIADLEPVGDGHRLLVLGPTLQPERSWLVDLARQRAPLETRGPQPRGLTGTGTIAALDQAIEAGLVSPPRIRTDDRRLHFGEHLFFGEEDLAEAGKAIGAVRAGYFTLSVEAGLAPAAIQTAFLAGASGTYVDARKSRRLGLIPPAATNIHHVGNTSLAMARELALKPQALETMSALAGELQQTHCLFAASRTFANVFLLELAYWTEGMPMSTYRELLRRHRLPDLPPVSGEPHIVHAVQQDIDDLGRLGLVTLEQVGRVAAVQVDGCLGCLGCVEACPAGALSFSAATEPPTLSLAHGLCDGVACRRCERACPSNVFHLDAFFAPATRKGSDGSPGPHHL